jgi:Lrp/AsnC family leucine-responsive transcriptional regulator
MLDDIDLQILRMLQDNARMPNSEIARRLDMAPSAILERIRKLENRGAIKGYEAKLDPKALGFGMLAFISVKTSDRTADFEAAQKLQKIPEVLEVHNIVGEDCYLVKVRVQDVEALRNLLHDKVSQIGSVVSTKTTIVLEALKESGKVPLGAHEAAAMQARGLLRR